MSRSFELESPDHFTAGAVGPPGERVFYLQARENGGVVTLKTEKEQVGALGQYLNGLLVRLGGAGQTPGAEAKLIEPVTPAWAVGSLGVGYDGRRDRLVIEAREALAEDSEETTQEPATARFHLTRAQAAAFAERARAIMKGGRPTCPLCNEVLEPGDRHHCPRANGAPPRR
ncbi:MAG TPA: DUF3090 family protein [Methylomirabilota bacterium]|jgi:uncharacterized repeat protein (TIGR03847 family)